MAETLKAKLGNCLMLCGTATMTTDSDPDCASVTVRTGLNRVLSATATYAESNVTNGPIYRSVSAGDVTFYAYGNQSDIDIDYNILGI